MIQPVEFLSDVYLLGYHDYNWNSASLSTITEEVDEDENNYKIINVPIQCSSCGQSSICYDKTLF